MSFELLAAAANIPNAQKSMADEQEVSASFPTAGLDVTCEFGRQPVDTAADSQNVRSVDASTQKLRGGSRSGLSKYIPDTVSGAFLIQHLAVLVDPQQPGLMFDADPTYPDPSTNIIRTRVPPGRQIRLGGSAIDPRGNDDRDESSSIPTSFRQSRGYNDFTDGFLDIGSGRGPGERTVSFLSEPAENSVLVVGVIVYSEGSGQTLSVRNSAGTAYTQIGSYQYGSGVGAMSGLQSLSLWRKSVGGIPSQDQSIKIDVGGANVLMSAAITEVRGVFAIPSDYESRSQYIDSPVIFDSGPLSVAEDDSVCVCIVDDLSSSVIIYDGVSDGYSQLVVMAEVPQAFFIGSHSVDSGTTSPVLFTFSEVGTGFGISTISAIFSPIT